MTAPLEPTASRLAALRGELARQQLDGFIVPISDEHMSEYVGAYAQRLAWLTGFGGSAGTAAVLRDGAAIAVDGRYELQVRDQVAGANFTPLDVPRESLALWVAEHVREGDRIGFDAWLHGEAWVKAFAQALSAKGASLVPVAANPIDAIWTDRPQPSNAPATPYPEQLAGRSSADKRAELGEWLRREGHDAVIVSALDSIAWLFNLRGRDVAGTPVALAFASVRSDGTATLHIDPVKVTPELAQALGNAVKIAPRADFGASLAGFAGRRVAVDPERTVVAIIDALEAAGATVVRTRDPVVLAKAVKNAAELDGMRAAHVKDGVAITRFLAWFDAEAPKGELDELAAAAKIAALRGEEEGCFDASFDTIAGAGPNGAIMHYRVSQETNRPIETGSLFLLDSGGQYAEGTTDITRTMAVGEPTAEMRRRYTQVLKGHIALSTARFPHGTRGGQLDILARHALWQDGADYAHGTGHGVGHALAVHEGPQRIAKPGGAQPGTDEPLLAGMILSNEPGYYKPGAFGIRIENLIAVRDATQSGDEQPMLGFENLTFAPLDRRLIDVAMLSADERRWVDDYHATICAKLGERLDPETQAWLYTATAPLEGAA